MLPCSGENAERPTPNAEYRMKERGCGPEIEDTASSLTSDL
jgi:hypothetical protein